MIITIDGPTASGKSTVARLLAQRLNWYYLNSGLLYRAVAYLLQQKFGYNNEQLLHPTQSHLEHCLSLIDYHYNAGARIMAEGRDITGELKTSSMDQAASLVATSSLVRHSLLAYQRTLAAHHDIVADGRDTGSVVFPQADYKFFLTASLQSRAKRWQHDQQRQGNYFGDRESSAHIEERDMRDSQRKDAPLVIATGAFVIDNSSMTIEETVSALVAILNRK